MIVPVMAISNLVLTQQIYSEETNGAHAPYREPVPLSFLCNVSNTTVTTVERPGTRQPNRRPSNCSHREDHRVFTIYRVSLNVNHLIVNGDV